MEELSRAEVNSIINKGHIRKGNRKDGINMELIYRGKDLKKRLYKVI